MKMERKMRITVLSMALFGLILLMPGKAVYAAEASENSNSYTQKEISAESAEASPLVSLYSVKSSSTTSTSITHHSSVSSSYGLLGGCTLSGKCWCTKSDSKVSASYSAVSTFYHSNGDQLVSGAKAGSSSSSSNFTWSASDDTSGQFYTKSTSTDTTCSKSGYNTVHITNTTKNS